MDESLNIVIIYKINLSTCSQSRRALKKKGYRSSLRALLQIMYISQGVGNGYKCASMRYRMVVVQFIRAVSEGRLGAFKIRSLAQLESEQQSTLFLVLFAFACSHREAPALISRRKS